MRNKRAFFFSRSCSRRAWQSEQLRRSGPFSLIILLKRSITMHRPLMRFCRPFTRAYRTSFFIEHTPHSSRRYYAIAASILLGASLSYSQIHRTHCDRIHHHTHDAETGEEIKEEKDVGERYVTPSVGHYGCFCRQVHLCACVSEQRCREPTSTI